MRRHPFVNCFHCGGPVHGGPCSQATVEAAACESCLYRAAEPDGLCDLCKGVAA